MGFLSYIPILGKLFTKSLDIVDQVVEDKDKANEIKASIINIEKETDKVLYLAELNTKTIPWLDGLHKMGRQILNFLTIVAVVVLRLFEIEITMEMALL
jgi:hypothetical protein